jgi:hypothetical protein
MPLLHQANLTSKSKKNYDAVGLEDFSCEMLTLLETCHALRQISANSQ